MDAKWYTGEKKKIVFRNPKQKDFLDFFSLQMADTPRPFREPLLVKKCVSFCILGPFGLHKDSSIFVTIQMSSPPFCKTCLEPQHDFGIQKITWQIDIRFWDWEDPPPHVGRNYQKSCLFGDFLLAQLYFPNVFSSELLSVFAHLSICVLHCASLLRLWWRKR